MELRFFGGLSIEETAEALDISPATVKREWSVARLFLPKESPEPYLPPIRRKLGKPMDSSKWERIKSIVAEALDLDARARPAFVADACGPDADLRKEVEGLLSFDSASDPFAQFANRETEPHERVGA